MKYSCFVACAIQDQTQEHLREVEAFVEAAEAEFGPCFYAAREFPDPEDYPPPEETLNLIRDAVRESGLFVLYYPEKVASGAIVELGMATAFGKPSVCYTRDTENLTYFLRAVSDLMIVNDPSQLMAAARIKLGNSKDRDRQLYEGRGGVRVKDEAWERLKDLGVVSSDSVRSPQTIVAMPTHSDKVMLSWPLWWFDEDDLEVVD